MTPPTPFHKMIRDGIENCSRITGTSDISRITAGDFCDFYTANRDNLTERHPETIDIFFNNYIQNYILTNPILEATSLSEWILTMFAVYIMLRTAFFVSQDAANFACLTTSPTEEESEQLRKTIVRITSHFDRSIQHNPNALKALKKAITEQNMNSTAYYMLFAKY